MRQWLFILVVCVSGTAILLSLGAWQLRRLDWKEAMIAEAEARIAGAPVALPNAPNPEHDRYRTVAVAGTFTGAEALVLTSSRGQGPGFRVIAAFETGDGRRIMIDRGFIPEAARLAQRGGGTAEVIGHLAWPDDVSSATPTPDLEANLWFGRDVTAMSEWLDTAPLMVVARSDTGAGVTPWPVTSSFRNDHLGYAMTWFGLALVWVGMTLGWLWRIRARKV